MPRTGGFTLLEVLVAMAVLGLLLLLLEQGVSFGLHASALQMRAEESGNAEVADAETALRGLVAAADAGIFPEPASLRGSAASVSLLTRLPGSDGTSQRSDATLFAAGGQLRLRWTPHRHVTPLDPAPAPQEVVLLDGVDALRIGYATPGQAEWRSTWDGEALPALVRLELAFRSPARRWPPIMIAPKLDALPQ